MSGARPNRPQGSLDLGLTDGVWAMMEECWDTSDRRWSISRIVAYLEASITSTAKMFGPSGRIEPESSPTNPSQTESMVIQSIGWKKPLRRLSRLFRKSPIQRTIRRISMSSRLRKGRDNM